MSDRQNEFVAKLFELHGKDLFRFLRNRLRGPDVEDVVQEAYVHLLQNTRAEAVQNPRAFLFRTALNLTIDRARYREVRARYAASPDVDASAEPSPRPGPEEMLHSADQFEHLREALNELPPLCRHAFLLNWIDGLSSAEIAVRLKVSKRTVERYMARAIDHCYRRLHES